MTAQRGRKLNQILRMLRKHCSVDKPVKVICKNLDKTKMCGCCIAYVNRQGKITRFAIHIDSNLGQLTEIDTLLHEWAHVLDQALNGIAVEPHRNSWGECYARVWRAYDAYITD